MPVQFHCSQCRRTLSVGQRKSGSTVACPKCGAPNVVPRIERDSATSATTVSSPAAPAPEPATIASDSAALAEAVAFDEIPGLIAMIDSMPVAQPNVQRSLGAARANQAAAPLIAEPPAAATPTPASLPAVSAAPPPVASPPPIFTSPATPEVRSPGDVSVGIAAAPPAESRTLAKRGRRGRRDEAMLLISRKAVYAQAALMAAIALAALAAGYVIGRGTAHTPASSEAGSTAAPVVSDLSD